MAKESKETFSGKLKDQTFEVFDEKVLTWCRKQFGDYYAKGLWCNELPVLDYLDLTEDEMSYARVYEVLSIKSPKEADHLYASDRFWEKKWQLEFRQRCRERIFCYLEEACGGEAVRQLRKLGVRMMESMREYMFRRFGAGQPEILSEI
jgi:hypothetical protein